MAKTARVTISKRSEPHQDRSLKTYNLILEAAANLLCEVGFEDLSTNMICKRAGVTPPALYRYFPNKYAILKTLGENLMERQNEILADWDVNISDDDQHKRDIRQLLQATIDVTRSVQAGDWIMRTLHASPKLAGVRLDSHRAMASLLTQRLLDARPQLNRDHVFGRMRIAVELGYATVEMVFDEPSADEDFLLDTTADLLAQNFRLALEQIG